MQKCNYNRNNNNFIIHALNVFHLYYIILPRSATQSCLCCVSLRVTAGHTHHVRQWPASNQRTLQHSTLIGCRSVTYKKLESVSQRHGTHPLN